MKYHFEKYRPDFFTGFESEVDEIDFDDWKDCINKYEQIFPHDDDYYYAFDRYFGGYILMDVKKDNSEWWVIGYTNYPLRKVYKRWERYTRGGS